MKLMSAQTASLVTAILVTGALLNVANSGKLGGTMKKLANFVTNGYGAGPLS